jgi:hypothetical protein
MSSSAPNPGHASPVSWGVALAATSLLLIGGGAIIWSNQAESASGLPAPPAAENEAEVIAGGIKLPPRTIPAAKDAPFALHTVSFSMENGTRVVKIRVVPDGDELIVDAATGRLLETRPSRPTAPPPMGKFAAPFAPMT